MAGDINRDYKGKTPLLLPVLEGAFVFTAALAQKLTIPAKFSFIKFKSYQDTQSTGQLNKLIGLSEDIAGQDIIIVEDIVDTGFTISRLMDELEDSRAASIKIASLLVKPQAMKVHLNIDYKGIEIPNRFVVGYGMDYNELGRNLPGIYVLSE